MNVAKLCFQQGTVKHEVEQAVTSQLVAVAWAELYVRNRAGIYDVVLVVGESIIKIKVK
jgi:hypothetical protein